MAHIVDKDCSFDRICYSNCLIMSPTVSRITIGLRDNALSILFVTWSRYICSVVGDALHGAGPLTLASHPEGTTRCWSSTGAVMLGLAKLVRESFDPGTLLLARTKRHLIIVQVEKGGSMCAHVHKMH